MQGGLAFSSELATHRSTTQAIRKQKQLWEQISERSRAYTISQALQPSADPQRTSFRTLNCVTVHQPLRRLVNPIFFFKGEVVATLLGSKCSKKNGSKLKQAKRKLPTGLNFVSNSPLL